MRGQLLFLSLFFSGLFSAYSQVITHVDITGASSVSAGQQTTFNVNFYNNSSQVAPGSGSYYWDTNGATSSGSTVSSNALTWAVPGTYSIYYEYSDISGTFYDYLTVTVTGTAVDPCPSVIPSAPGATLIANGPVTLLANPAPVGFTYQWYDSDQSTLLRSTQDLPLLMVSASKTYYVAYRYTATGCITSKMPVRINHYAENLNWTREYAARIPLKGDFVLRNSSQANSYKKTSYHDGLGRVSQQVAIQASVDGSDIITPTVYDAYGRQYRDYLPFPDNSTGVFRTSATTLHSNYYTAQYTDSRGYADKTYETSPLSRVIKQGVPGTPWVGKDILINENTNGTGDEVRIWTLDGSGLPTTSTNYPSGALFKIETTNENQQRVIEYKDKLGRLILKKVQLELSPANNHTGWICTYYIYDSFGRLRVVMPPNAVKAVIDDGQSPSNSALADGSYYLYTYDERGRQITKKIPDKGIEEIVYDLQDRPVAWRDAKLTAAKKWIYTKYDALGRVVLTGIVTYTTAPSRATLQSHVNTLGNNNAILNSTSGRTGATNAGGYPQVGQGNGEGEVLSANFYDNYSLANPGMTYIQRSGFDAQSSKTLGLLTGRLVTNLSNGVRVETVIFYDSQGREIQTLEEHHLGGFRRFSSRYNFENKILQNITEFTSSFGSNTMYRYFYYDAAGQLSSTTHQINSSPTVTLANYAYNNLGQLTKKTVTGAGNTPIDYSYNIRGWIKKINDPQVSNALNKVFAQELFYESGGGFNQFSGNIAKAEWRGRDDVKRVYNYYYDMNNRLADVLYTVPGVPAENGRYNLGYVSYDLNGNFQTLWRLNEQSSGNFGVVDMLNYSYYPHSQRLKGVSDGQSDPNFVSKDFKDVNTTDYVYDANGNLTVNADKNITSIIYNHLNLPAVINFTGTNRKSEIHYNNDGTKLRQINTDGANVKTIDYLGEFVYENNALSYVVHEEGRAAYENGVFQYEFFVKDHLGNVRQVIRAPVSALRVATMEPENAAEEEELFENLKESRQGAAEHNKTPGGYTTAWLNADRGRVLGPSRTQEIQEGDSVEIGVFGKYVDPRKTRLRPVSFIRTGANTRLIQQLTEFGQNLQSAGPNELGIANVLALVISDLQQKPVPEAYMGYALYDADSNRYEVGKVVLSKKARNKHEELVEKIAIKKDGYIETFLVNETEENVWFDQFRILSTGPLIVQETHYDPWGVELSGLGYQYGGIKVNPYLYGSKEANGHLGVNIHDFGARMYDPAIGRWFVPDPMAEQMRRHSPYNYAFNNPMRYIDPDGMRPVQLIQGSPKDSESEDPTQNEISSGQFQYLKGGYGENIEVGSVWSHQSNGDPRSSNGQNDQTSPSQNNPTIFVNMHSRPKSLDSDQYLKDLKSTLVNNGFSENLVVEKNSLLGKLKAWWNNSPTATITLKDFSLPAGDRLDAGGYAEPNNSHSMVVYNGLSPTGKNNTIESWKYINASVHEIGHGIFGFSHETGGLTNDSTSIMDYRSAYKQGAGFNENQRKTVKNSPWGGN